MDPRPATLITGASAGLGVEFARQCAARGDEVILVARRKDRLNKLAAELGKAHVIAADLGKPNSPAKLLEEIKSRGLWVRTLINNAGFGLRGRFGRALELEFHSMLLVLSRARKALCALLVQSSLIARIKWRTSALPTKDTKTSS